MGWKNWAASQYRAGIDDPVTKALTTFGALRQLDIEKEDRELKREDMALRKRADARAAEESAQRLEAGQQAIDFAAYRQDQRTEENARKDTQRRLRGEEALTYLPNMDLPPSQVLAESGSRKIARGELADKDELAGFFTSRGAVNLHRGESLENVIRANDNLIQFFGQDLPSMPNLKDQTLFDRDQHPELEDTFQSIERLAADRKGFRGDYQVLDLATNKVVTRQGKISRVKSILYDKKTDSVAVSLEVVDAETGQPMISPEGQPLVVPATAGRTAHPEDRIKFQPRNVLVESAKMGTQQNISALSQLERQTKLNQRYVILANLVKAGDESALKELKEVDHAQNLSDQYVALSQDMGFGELERGKFARAAQMLQDGFPIDEAKAVAETAMAGKAREEETQRAQAQAEFVHNLAMGLEAEKGRWKVLVAEIGAGKITKKQAQDEAAKSRDKARELLQKAENKAHADYSDVTTKIPTVEDPDTGENRKMTEDEFVAMRTKSAREWAQQRARDYTRLLSGGTLSDSGGDAGGPRKGLEAFDTDAPTGAIQPEPLEAMPSHAATQPQAAIPEAASAPNTRQAPSRGGTQIQRPSAISVQRTKAISEAQAQLATNEAAARSKFAKAINQAPLKDQWRAMSRAEQARFQEQWIAQQPGVMVAQDVLNKMKASQ